MRRQHTQHSRMTGGLTVIGGTAIGAALMYLLDPQAGRRRRAHLAETAGHAATRAGDVLHNAWDMATEAGGALAERATELGATGAAAASSMGSSLAEHAGDTAHRLHKGARHHMHGARHTVGHWFGHEEKSHMPSAGATISAAACLAAGVGIMYLLDPTDGARRRALARDKMVRCLNETGDFFRKTGRHLRNRARGVSHETMSMFQRDDATDRQVAERIRSRIGHLGQQSNVDVMVLDGRVTISGRCAPGDVDALLSTVQQVPGVSSIVNQLDVRSESESSNLGGSGAPTSV